MNEERKTEYRRDADAVPTELALEVSFDFPGENGSAVVEYKPRKYVLNGDGREFLKEYRKGIDSPEEVVGKLYLKLVEILYPGYEKREKPWMQAPMLVTFEWTEGHRNVTGAASLGSMF